MNKFMVCVSIYSISLPVTCSVSIFGPLFCRRGPFVVFKKSATISENETIDTRQPQFLTRTPPTDRPVQSSFITGNY